MDIEFVPCDRHNDLPAVNMAVGAKGQPVFECLKCLVLKEAQVEAVC